MTSLEAIYSLTSPQVFVVGLQGAWFAAGAGFVAILAFCIFRITRQIVAECFEH
jgi:hypothetical protein